MHWQSWTKSDTCFYWIDPVETAKRLVAKIFVIRRVFYWVGSLETSRSAIYFAYLTYLIYYAYLTCYAYLTYYSDIQEGNVFKCEPAPACHRMHAIDLGVIVTLIKAMMWQRLGWIMRQRLGWIIKGEYFAYFYIFVIFYIFWIWCIFGIFCIFDIFSAYYVY